MTEQTVLIDQTVQAIWYASYEQGVDMLCLLRMLDKECQIAWWISSYDDNGDIEEMRQRTARKPLVPLSVAIERTRDYIVNAPDQHPVRTWEVIRGARSDAEFCALLASMPRVSARIATAEEVAAMEREARGTR